MAEVIPIKLQETNRNYPNLMNRRGKLEEIWAEPQRSGDNRT